MDSQGDIILNNRGLRTNSKFIHEGHFMQVKTKTSRLKWRSEVKRGTRRASSRSRTMFEAYLLVTQRSSLCGGAVRDDTKNGFVADFRKFYPMNSGPG